MKMKRLLAIALIGLYLLLNLGINLSAHFCGGSLKSISLSTEADKCCCDGDGISKSCCSDKTVYLQYDNDDKQVSSFRLAIGKFYVSVKNTDTQDAVVKNQTLGLSDEQRRGPPLEQPLWLSNCSLTYYG